MATCLTLYAPMRPLSPQTDTCHIISSVAAFPPLSLQAPDIPTTVGRAYSATTPFEPRSQRASRSVKHKIWESAHARVCPKLLNRGWNIAWYCIHWSSNGWGVLRFISGGGAVRRGRAVMYSIYIIISHSTLLLFYIIESVCSQSFILFLAVQ